MVGSVGWNRVLHALVVPGIVLHELAHALTVVLVPGVRITALDLTSHVSHEGRYTVTRSFLISYAPLWTNTGVALLAAYHAAGVDPTNGSHRRLQPARSLRNAVRISFESTMWLRTLQR